MMFSIQMVSSPIFVKIPANRIPDFLSSLSFSLSETSLIYIAEANVNGDDDASNNPYPKFRYTPHFGEPSRTKKRPTIFLFRLVMCWAWPGLKALAWAWLQRAQAW